MSSFRSPITVRRVKTGTYTLGRYGGETEQEIKIMASVQPASGKQLESLEEGRRNRASFVLFTDTELRTIQSQNPDRVKLFGDDYEAVTIEPWQNGVIPHYRVLVQKLQPTAEAVSA